MKNILVSSAGRRVGLVQAFQQQIEFLNLKSTVHAVDFQPELSSACQVADQSAACPMALDAGYIDFLLDYCLKHQIGLVIPTIDTELQVLAQAKQKFLQKGISLCVSTPELIGMCRDKRNTGELFKKYGVRYPEIYSPDNLTFPCFSKPAGGSCSIGARPLLTRDALTSDIINDPEMMFMELIDKSYVEYTIDAYYDKGSVLKCFVPRKRLETRAGEVSKGITRRDAIYFDLVERMGAIAGAAGCLTIQFFVNENTGDYIGLEINPRFGGGYPLSYAAGANYPNWLIKEYILGEEIAFYDEWQNNLLMLRYDAQVLVHDAEF